MTPKKILGLSTLLFLCALVSFHFGSTDFGLPSLFNLSADTSSVVIADMRATRMLNAALVGALFALSGNVLQRLLMNPLADPFVLGISSGGTATAVIYSLLGAPALFGFVPLKSMTALVGCLVTLFFLLWVRRKMSHREDTYSIAVIGLILNAFFGAAIMLAFAFSQHGMQSDAYRWLIGSLQDASHIEISVVLFVSTIAGLALFRLASKIDVLATGDEFAESLGFRPEKIRTLALVFTALLVAGAVSLAGSIGFVGLIVPHISRRFFPGNTQAQWVMSLFVGASALLLADAVSRTLLSPTELPVGIFTALVGIPALTVLVVGRRHGL